MADILLIKPPCPHSILPPLGIGYLSAALKKQGHSTRIIHGSKDNLDVDGVVKIIDEHDFDFVGVSACSNDHPWLEQLARELESRPRLTFVAGGAHPTGLAERLMQMLPRIDFIIRAESEIAFPRLVRALETQTASDDCLSAIPNLVWKDSAGHIKENPIQRIEDIDAIDFPDWDQMKPAEYAEFAPHGGGAKAYPVGQIVTTRGCPYACSYCAGSLMHGTRIRARSPESIIEEMKYLIKDHHVKEFHIEDDNFTFNKEHVLNFCQAVRRNNINAFFTLPNGVRLDKLDDEILRQLKETGFYSFSIGIESGSQQTLKRMRKALNLDIVKETIQRIRKHGFLLKGYFMIGYPGETEQDITRTIEYAKSLDLDRAYFTMYIPLPGTRDFHMLEQQGKITLDTLQWQNFYTKGKTLPPYVPDGMNAEQLERFAHIAYRRFYVRPKIMLNMLKDLKITSPRQLADVIWNLLRLNLSYFI
jgi:radical SAM superfamily enzyme YgiQ (UPF0313 family)